MTALGTAVIFMFIGALAVWRGSVRARVRVEQRALLQPGSVVLVRTPDRKQLVATVLSRGASHFWIELAPGDARWWVPATAVEPAPEEAVLESERLRQMPRTAPRRALGSEI